MQKRHEQSLLEDASFIFFFQRMRVCYRLVLMRGICVEIYSYFFGYFFGFAILSLFLFINCFLQPTSSLPDSNVLSYGTVY